MLDQALGGLGRTRCCATPAPPPAVAGRRSSALGDPPPEGAAGPRGLLGLSHKRV